MQVKARAKADRAKAKEGEKEAAEAAAPPKGKEGKARGGESWLAAEGDAPGRRMRQTLQGSFSAVSKPNCASKYALEISRRDLHNALLCTVLKARFLFKNLRTFGQYSRILRKFDYYY